MASLLPSGMDEDRVGTSAAMLSLGDRTVEELARGIVTSAYQRGSRLHQ